MTKKKPAPAPKKQNETPQQPALKNTANPIPGQKHIKYLAAILCFICIALYANSIGNGYAIDDDAAITQNKIVHQGVSGIPELVHTGFLYGMYGYTSSKFSYRPISLISFAIEHSLWGDNPHISHAVNILLFALTVVLIFYLLQKILPGRLRIFTAFVISALFAAHPIHTEVVTYIKSRDEIFSFLFILLSMLYAIKYLETEKMQKVVFAALFFFLALMSKESAITFVAIIPFTLFYFLITQKGRLIRCCVALGAAMAAYLALRIIIFGDLIHSEVNFAKLDNFMQTMGFAARLPVAITVIGKYMLKLLFPHPLSFDYAYNVIPAYTIGSWEFILSLLACIGLFIFAVYGFRKRSVIGFAIIFFFLSMAVVSNVFFLIGNIFAERFLYAPSLAFCIASGYGIMLLYRAGAESDGLFSLKSQPAAVLCLSVILVLYSVKTIARNPDWESNYSLCIQDVKYADKSARIHFMLGNIYLGFSKSANTEAEKKDLITKAENELETSLKIFPENEPVKHNLLATELNNGEYDKANALFNKGVAIYDTFTAKLAYNMGVKFFDDKNYAGAIAKYKMALAANPNFAKAYINLGSAYQILEFYDSAISILNQGINLKPNDISGYTDIGLCYYKTKQYANATEAYKKMLELDPNSADAFVGMGNISMDNNDFDNALNNMQKALNINPKKIEALNGMGYIYLQRKNYKEASAYLKKSYEQKQDDFNILAQLGFCALQLNESGEAVQYFNRMLKINPNDNKTYYNLAYAYKEAGDEAKAKEYKEKGDELAARANAKP